LCGTSAEVSVNTLFNQMRERGVDTSALDRDEFYEGIWRRVAQHIDQDDLPWQPGVPELLADIKQAALPCAVVSSSPPVVLRAGLSRFPAGVVSVVIDAFSVTKGKPDPEGYRLAAHRLGVDPAACVVLEDTLAGTAAGRAAGAVVLAIPSMQALPDEPGQVVRESLAGVDVAALRRLYADVRLGRCGGGQEGE
jgi:HAD superfamily hydrolase (TIGR01509 family)